MEGAQIVGLGALAAIVASTWGHIKTIFFKLYSIIFVTIEVKNSTSLTMSTIAQIYREFKPVRIGLRWFIGQSVFVRPIDRVELVSGELLLTTDPVFCLGKRPWKSVIIKRSVTNNTEDYNPNEMNGKSMTVTYIRGQVDIERIIVEGLKNFNEERKENGFSSRFSVIDLFGEAVYERMNKTENEAPSTVRDYDVTDYMRNSHIRYLGWRPDQLGRGKDTRTSASSSIILTEQVERLAGAVNMWYEGKKWYRERGILWRRGFLLHGKPGCGKSMVIRYLGEKFDLPIFSFHLSTFDDQEFVTTWNDRSRRAPCIFLVEDIDSVFHGRENIVKGNTIMSRPLSFDTFLNCIDGVSRSDGILLFITTNNIDKVDPAIGTIDEDSGVSSRPGRVDAIYELGEFTYEDCLKMVKHIIPELPEEEVDKMARAGQGRTPAQFMDICVQRALSGKWKDQRLKIAGKVMKELSESEDMPSELVKVVDDNVWRCL